MIGRGRPLTADELAQFRADSRQPHVAKLPISAEDLAAYRRFAEDAHGGDEPRSPIILRLLDEIDRLKAAFVPQPARMAMKAHEYSPQPRWFCASPNCPGYPNRASDYPHPADTCGSDQRFASP
jgi:hypothetical protein